VVKFGRGLSGVQDAWIPAHDLLGRISGDLRELAINVADVALGVSNDDRDWALFDCHGELL
jgi:hypothetical protein